MTNFKGDFWRFEGEQDGRRMGPGISSHPGFAAPQLCGLATTLSFFVLQET
jgi:hypothetical protein